MKRLFAFFTALILMLSMLPTVIPTASAATYYTDITSTDTFDYVIEKVRDEENDYIAERIKLMIYGNEEYNPHGVGEKWFDTSSYLTIYDGERDEYVKLRSAQCYGYANYVYHKLFGITCYDDGNTTVDSISRSNMSVSRFKTAISKARCGAHIRGGGSHSLVFLTTDADNNGFYYLEAYDYNGPYKVHLSYCTYSQFVSRYGSLNFLYLPETYPSYDLPSTLTVSNFSYPTTKKSGSGFTPSGKVMSNCDITKITASVTDASGDVVFSRTVSPSSKYWDIAWFNSAMEFSSLRSSGTYTYNLTATDSSSASVSIKKSFTVGSSDTKSATVTVEAVTSTPSTASENSLATLNDTTKTYTRKGDSFSESGVINGKNVVVRSSATVTISGIKYYQLTDGSWVNGTTVSPLKTLTVSATPNKTAYMDYEKLNTEGLRLTVTCENGSSFAISSGYEHSFDDNAVGAVAVTVTYCGLSTSFTINVTETDVVVGEKYEVLTSLRYRTHAGLSHEQVGTLPDGAIVTVTEKMVADGYTWGLIEYNGLVGWCALEYASYISGSIVNEISVPNTQIRLEMGEKVSLGAIALPSLASDTSLRYSSSNASIVSVDEAGNVTAGSSLGSAIITVTSANGISRRITVFVTGEIDYSLYLDAVFGEDGLVSGIPIETTADAFLAKYDAEIYDKDGNQIIGDTVIATGMTVNYGGKSFTVIVMGDASGDGIISSTDFTICRKNFLGLHSINEATASAADVDGDGLITSTDFLQIRKHYLQLYNIYA